ncbi:MAG: hypothetical protein M3299_09285 [Thermoproteota archaeon]|nr:hypothetical protein [Thermoproteota archaeon]
MDRVGFEPTTSAAIMTAAVRQRLFNRVSNMIVIRVANQTGSGSEKNVSYRKEE